jgi:divalent metal cation (Fe/Co/Zn/Cd) transporter
VDAAWYAIALAAAAIVVESVRAPLLQWAGRRFASPALRAGAQNRLADIFSATGVLLGLIGVRLGFYWADAVAALLVAAIIFRSAALLAWRSGDILIDRAPSGVEDAVRDTIAGVHGVRDVRSVRVRRSGDRMIGDAVVTARPTLTVEGAQQLREEVATAVREGHPRLDLALVVESQSDAEHLVERVHAVTDRQPLVRDVHNVTVEREQDGSLHLSLHVKLPGEMTLEAAGRTSALIETSLRNEFPELHRVDVHLEPLEPDSVAGADVTQRRADLAGRIRRLVEEHPAVLRCTDVELSARGPELVAHVVASLRGELTLKQAHEVETELEEHLRRALPEVSEVVARVTP